MLGATPNPAHGLPTLYDVRFSNHIIYGKGTTPAVSLSISVMKPKLKNLTVVIYNHNNVVMT